MNDTRFPLFLKRGLAVLALVHYVRWGMNMDNAAVLGHSSEVELELPRHLCTMKTDWGFFLNKIFITNSTCTSMKCACVCGAIHAIKEHRSIIISNCRMGGEVQRASTRTTHCRPKLYISLHQEGDATIFGIQNTMQQKRGDGGEL